MMAAAAPQKEWSPDVCVYHAPCDDGFASAWAVRKKWGDRVAYAPRNYGMSPPDVDGANVLVADFSFPERVLSEMASRAASVVVLDHHKTARDDLRRFSAFEGDAAAAARALARMKGDGLLFADNVLVSFDMDRSGAMLAWRFAHGASVPPPRLVEIVEDRDLWRFAHEETRRVSLLLRSHPYDFDVWDRLAAKLDGDEVERLEIGREAGAIERFYDRKVDEILAAATTRRIGRDEVPVVNAPFAFASDCANELLKRHPDAPFAASYYDAYGARTWSLRSEDRRADVSEIARAFGGGGHRNAAGFRTPL